MNDREQAIEMIQAERQRQITVESFDALHDSHHDPSRLAEAAKCYYFWRGQGVGKYGGVPGNWPWAREYWKPKTLIRDLERAGALYLAAEDAERARIERDGDNEHGWGKARADRYHERFERVAKELAWVLADPAATAEAESSQSSERVPCNASECSGAECFMTWCICRCHQTDTESRRA